MTNVQFEEENQGSAFTSHSILGAKVVPSMARSFIKMGMVKNQKQAEYLMIAIIIICVALTLYFTIPQRYYMRAKDQTVYQEDIPENVRSSAKGQMKDYIDSLPHRK